MSTKTEQARAEEQRRGRRKGKERAERTKPGVAPRDRSREKLHAGRKATHALETEAAPGSRPSRKSTRKSANRAKPDTAFNLTEELRKGSPEARFRKSRARASKARGGATR